jgi:mannose/fructose/N-acetylgalactosamine-specific phosphotransferase system component IIB
MGIVLFRVDERLVHGQVTVGWGASLNPQRYLVVDDRLSESEWEQELYRLGIPAGIEVEFASVAAAQARLQHWDEAREVSVLLTRDLSSMARLAATDGLPGGAVGTGGEVNLGGIHHAEGRMPVLPYLHLGDPERAAIRALLGQGIAVVARDLPGAAPVDATRFIEAG